MADFTDRILPEHEAMMSAQSVFFRGHCRGGCADQPLAEGV